MTKIINKYFICLFFIVLCASFLRFYQLGKNPPSLTWDEASWGYNAYSLGINGQDEFGRFLPVDYLESFGDFKPPMYAYLDILPVKIFGLNEFATRLPSALFGVLTVLITYFLVKEIFKKSLLREYYALSSAFVLAFSPWHIMLSRAAFEANIATFFLITGVWLFIKAMQGKSWVLVLSVVSFVLSLYTFNSSRVVAPLLVLTLFIIYRKQLLAAKKAFILACLVGVVLSLPVGRFLLTPQSHLRFQEVNIFSDPDLVKMSNQEIANDNNALWSKIIHNRRVLYSFSFLRHYFDNLSPNFLFIKGDGNPKFSAQDVGEMYLWDLVFFCAGILLLFKNKEGKWLIIPLWLILGIIPAATARETPHALRIEATLPTFQILTGYGMVMLLSKINNLKLSKKLLFYATIILLFIFNTAYFLHGYFSHYPLEYSGEWQYGYKDSIAYVESVISQYDQAQITDALGRPYIYYLFYTKTNPYDFRKTAVIQRDVFGFVHVQSFGKFVFPKNITASKNKKTLYIQTPDAVPGDAKRLQTFYLLNGNAALVAYTL